MHCFAQRHEQVDDDSVVDFCPILRIRFHDGFARVNFDRLFLKHVDERQEVTLKCRKWKN